jgi:hypothetical protein
VEIHGVEYEFPDYIEVAPDFHLQSDSPCIDAGTSDGAPTFDIEGNLRPCGTGVDIGAYEFGDCGAALQFRRGLIDSNEAVDLTDPVYLLNYLFASGPPPSCPKAADVNDTGNLDLTDAVYLLGHLFLGGPPPAEPFQDCGPDPTIDPLPCASFTPCE